MQSIDINSIKVLDYFRVYKSMYRKHYTSIEQITILILLSNGVMLNIPILIDKFGGTKKNWYSFKWLMVRVGYIEDNRKTFIITPKGLNVVKCFISHLNKTV